MFKGRRFPPEIVLTYVRWYVRFKLSYRDFEEFMAERSVQVDHATVNRWVVKSSPMLLKPARSHRTPVRKGWRLDETYIKVGGRWKYLYRVVDKCGDTVDFLLTAKRDKAAALRFLRRAVGNNGVSVKVTIDGSGANVAAVNAYNAKASRTIEARQCQYQSKHR